MRSKVAPMTSRRVKALALSKPVGPPPPKHDLDIELTSNTALKHRRIFPQKGAIAFFRVKTNPPRPQTRFMLDQISMMLERNGTMIDHKPIMIDRNPNMIDRKSEYDRS